MILQTAKLPHAITISAVLLINGCATQSPSDANKWATLENDLAIYKNQREIVRNDLTKNPASANALMQSAEIGKLNRLITANERALTYALTEPVSTEPVLTVYTGLLPSELIRPLRVAKSAWEQLTGDERRQIKEKWNVELLGTTAYGIVIDSQILNESTAATNGGSNLGSAFAQSAYIDNAFKAGNNYSATNQVAIGVIGAIAGSSFDKRAVTQYRTRYSVRLADGNIQMTDDVKGDPFRLPVSICIQFPSLDMSDQSLCTQTAAALRLKHLRTVVDINRVP